MNRPIILTALVVATSIGSVHAQESDNTPPPLDQRERFLLDIGAEHDFGSQAHCLAELQIALNNSQAYASSIPFSTVWTGEDERGPVGRMRLILVGHRVHVEAWCQGSQLRAKELGWLEESNIDNPLDYTAKEAIVGAQYLQDALSTEREESKRILAEHEAIAGMSSDDSVPGSNALRPTLPNSESEVKAALEKALDGLLTNQETDPLLEAFQHLKTCVHLETRSPDVKRESLWVTFDMAITGRVKAETIKATKDGNLSPSEKELFEKGRRAIVKCLSSPIDLPKAQFDRWKTIDLLL